MAKPVQRKLFLFGRYSLAILIPKKWLNDLGLSNGDAATLRIERLKNKITIHFAEDDKKFTKAIKPAEKITETSDDPDMELIPEL